MPRTGQGFARTATASIAASPSSSEKSKASPCSSALASASASPKDRGGCEALPPKKRKFAASPSNVVASAIADGGGRGAKRNKKNAGDGRRGACPPAGPGSVPPEPQDASIANTSRHVAPKKEESSSKANDARPPPPPATVASSSSSTSTSAPKRRTTKKASASGGQKRYDPDPGVSMTREELSAWRKEQRRLRNRASAAESRRKTRDRIAELEAEVERWKERYQAVADKLRSIEVEVTAGGDGEGEGEEGPHKVKVKVSDPHGIPEGTRGGEAGAAGLCAKRHLVVSPSNSPPPSPRPSSPALVSPIACSSKSTERMGPPRERDILVRAKKKQHLTEMISRPAVKIAGVASSHSLHDDVTPIPCYCPSSSSADAATTEVVIPPADWVFDGGLQLDELLFDALSTLVPEDEK